MRVLIGVAIFAAPSLTAIAAESPAYCGKSPDSRFEIRIVGEAGAPLCTYEFYDLQTGKRIYAESYTPYGGCQTAATRSLTCDKVMWSQDGKIAAFSLQPGHHDTEIALYYFNAGKAELLRLPDYKKEIRNRTGIEIDQTFHDEALPIRWNGHTLEISYYFSVDTEDSSRVEYEYSALLRVIPTKTTAPQVRLAAVRLKSSRK